MRTPLGFFALDQAHHTGDFKSKFTRRFYRLDRGSTRGANIIDDHHPRAFFSKALDSLSCAVLFLGFADEEAVDLATGDGHSYHHRVGSHGQATDGLRPPSALANFLEEDLAGKLRAACVQRGGAAIHVIVTGTA